ncbi:hypothetical protein [Methylocella sp. CPCC 101449]|uniref:hypothetical protein n=1 Tax=Methylocella sp. CPCC 101449 TaxID=2987531 RepID=UPI0028913B6B|nr:hypothetical protein [Methylocella sp. CPCC 101449]MDT2023833.1 hypothetical protein [Methylocella sp. CPCC 101449]
MRSMMMIGALCLALFAPVAPATAKPENALIEAMLKGPIEARDAACNYVMAHPEAINPIYLSTVALSLWKRGDRAQAAFWFYVFQVRSRAWINADKSAAPLRGSLNQQIGAMINPWVASDLEAWYDIAGRALSYEKKIPLYPKQPADLTPEQWQAVVAKARQDNDAQFEEVIGGFRKDPAAFAAKRRENGLPVGPLQEPGAPLPSDWR